MTAGQDKSYAAPLKAPFFATSSTDMVTTRSKTGSSGMKGPEPATSSKVKSSAGKAAARPPEAPRPQKKQPVTSKETQQYKVGKNWKWQHRPGVSIEFLSELIAG